MHRRLPTPAEVASLAGGIVVVTLALTYIFTETHLLFTITSGSMSPAIKVGDLIIVNKWVSIDDLKVGDVIVFHSPDRTSGIVTHRIAEIVSSSEGMYIVTKGDANREPIPNIDFPVTQSELIGRVALVSSEGGAIVDSLRPPIVYYIIIIWVGVLACFAIWTRSRRRAEQART